jgi:hypothetical protein
MIKLTQLLEHNNEEYPPYMYSPVGFSCAVCEYYNNNDGKHYCNNKEYQKYMNTNELIDPKTKKQIKDPSKWCSNWFKPKNK